MLVLSLMGFPSYEIKAIIDLKRLYIFYLAKPKFDDE